MTIRILIADDNALVRAALAQVLGCQGEGHWEIIEAENGQEALLAAEKIKPDLVILDLAMPLMDGFRTAREIGKILPDTPILMHTLYWSPRVELEAMKVGVRKTVAKSDSNALMAAVKEVFPNRSASPPKETAPVATSPRSTSANSATGDSLPGNNKSDPAEGPLGIERQAS